RKVYRNWNEVFPCKDGYIMCSPFGGAGWEKILEWAAGEGMAADLYEPLYQNALKVMAWGQMDPSQLPSDIDKDLIRKHPEIVTHIEYVWEKFLMTHTREELYQGCQDREVRLMPIYNAKDVAEDPQLLARDFFVDVEHPEAGACLTYPGGPYRLSETPWKIKKRAPFIGEHNESIYKDELGLTQKEIDDLKSCGGI
ncbi:CoA transferase, partial [Thermodesulfobacteriota bacterium]